MHSVRLIDYHPTCSVPNVKLYEKMAKMIGQLTVDTECAKLQYST